MTGSAVLDSLKNNSSLPQWYGPHLVEKMLNDWAVLRTGRDWQRVIIEKKDEPGNWSWFQPLHRHHKRYKNKQRNRITRLQDYQRRARYFISMTVDPKLYSSDHEAMGALKGAWFKMYHRLKRRAPDLQVLRAVEAQKGGQPHMHLVLWGVYLPRSWGAQMWKLYGGYVKVERVRLGNAAAVSYLGKYLTKGSELDIAAITRWGAQTLTVCGKELRELLGPLKTEQSTGQWVFVEFVCSFDDACVLFSEGFAEELYEYPNGPPKSYLGAT